MKKWETLNQFKVQSAKFKVKELIRLLLENRGIKTEKEIEEFLNPKLEKVTFQNVGIDKKQLQKALKRIKKAIESKEKIVVYGDYDVDGVCATAIFWETLYSIGADVAPYIPHRVDEGYGISLAGISKIKDQKSKTKDTTLIITVDNGIVANEAVEFAKKQGIDVIITDHHVLPEKLPDAYAIVHTTKLCGAGVAWALAQEFKVQSSRQRRGSPLAAKFKVNDVDCHLELVALATIADMVPLLGANRILAKFGLEALKKTRRVGLLELFKEAVIDNTKIGVYEVGHIIAPRLNAMGRLEYAMDSLRLLCTKNKEKAYHLAQMLGITNKERQELTKETSAHASTELRTKNLESGNLLFIANEMYQPGVIGLVAGKLVEEFYRPSIVLSIGEKYSKASARSIHGFNIIEFIRSASEHLVDCGGHPMAAGFTVETKKITILKETLEKRAQALLDEEKLKRVLKIDCEIPLSIADQDLYDEIQKLAPFGMANYEPVFSSKNVTIEDMRLVGQDRKHIKFNFQFPISNFKFQMIEGIGFGLGGKAVELHNGDKVDIAYTIDENVWNGNKSLQLKIKDVSK